MTFLSPRLATAALAAALAWATPLAAQAELVITDWKTAGDQALMRDTISDREWLRLPLTAGPLAPLGARRLA